MSIEQTIAALARELVQAQCQPDDPIHEKETAYRALCESFPALLRSAGLVQAITYLEAKANASECKALLDHFESQFTALKLLGTSAKEKENLSAKITSEKFSMPQYRYYSHVAFKVTYWHKRLAQALLRQRAKSPAEARP